MSSIADERPPPPLRRWMNVGAVVAAGAFALALQLQITVDFDGAPVRLAAADLLGLLLAPCALLLLMRNRAALLQAPRPLWLALLVLATAAMTWSAAIGAWQGEGLNGWALKKYLGWFVLLGYAALGFLLAFTEPEAAPAAFIRCLAVALALTVLAYMALASVGKVWPVTNDERLSGFAGNPNAFGLMLLGGLALVLAQGRSERSRGWDWLAGVLCAGVLFCRSIAALCGLIALVPAFLLLFRPRAGVAMRIGVAAALAFAAPPILNAGLNALFPERIAASERYGIAAKVDAFASRGEGEGRKLYDSSVPSRMESGRQALGYWLERPVFGIGLGGFLQRDEERAAQDRDRPPMVIHSTPLWLLTETGLAGLAAFAALFGALALHLRRSISALDSGGGYAALLRGGLLVLIAWAAMSLAHELLYQRMPWFALGLCAGLALRTQSARPAPGPTDRAEPPPGSAE